MYAMCDTEKSEFQVLRENPSEEKPLKITYQFSDTSVITRNHNTFIAPNCNLKKIFNCLMRDNTR